MKLKELRSKVYELAKVDNTKQLKAKYTDFKHLDMRFKVSWKTALQTLEKQGNDFKNWLENPPEEYKEMFSEIQEVSKKYDQSASKTKHLIQNLQSITDSLDETAAELQGEAAQLDKQNKLAREVNEQAKLN